MRALTILLAVAVTVLTAQADPRMWDENGVMVRQGVHLQWEGQSASDNAGNTIAVWADSRTGQMHVYAQLYSADGVARWTDGGILVSAASPGEALPVACAVSDGWIVAWLHNVVWVGEGTLGGEVWAQKLDEQGNRLWPANEFNGVRLSAQGPCAEESLVGVVPDGGNGAYVIWKNIDPTDDARAQHVYDDGTSWAEPLIVANTGFHGGPDGAVADESGNLLVVWSYMTDTYDLNLYASKITPDGQLPWGESGVPVCIQENRQHAMDICPDGSGGCFIAWKDERDWPHNLYMQRLDNNGQALWTANGLPLCTAVGYEEDCRIDLSRSTGVPDGFIAAWEDYRNGSEAVEVFAQKIGLTGTAMWAENGVPVSDITDEFPGETPGLTSDNAGGLLCTWEDYRNGYDDRIQLYAQRILSTGLPAWTETGVRVIEEGGTRQSAIALAGTHCLIFCYKGSQAEQGLFVQGFDVAAGTRLLGDGGAVVRPDLYGDAVQQRAVTISENRAAVVWEDQRVWPYGSAIHYQIFDAAGNPQLPENGVRMAPDNEGWPYAQQEDPVLCEDGDGGFFCAFRDTRTGIGRIRVQHVNSLGQIIGNPAGVVVYDNPDSHDQDYAFCCADRTGGCFVAWSEYNPEWALDAYVMRIAPDGEPAWGEPIQLSNSDDDDVMYGVVSDGATGCHVVWRNGYFYDYNIVAARILGNRITAWTNDVCDEDGDQERPVVISDGSNGAFIAWTGDRYHGPFVRDIFAQHMDINGLPLWENNGVCVVSASHDQNNSSIALAPDGGLYAVWEDYRNNNNLTIYAQRLTAQGERAWPEEGLFVSWDDVNHMSPKAWSDADGNLFVAWQHAGVPYDRIHGSCISPLGLRVDPWWDVNSGGPISSGDMLELNPQLAPLNDRACLVVWIRQRTTGVPVADLRAQLVQTSVVGVGDPFESGLPSQFSLAQNYPNPFNPETRIEFALPKSADMTLAVYDLLGREVAVLMQGNLNSGYHTASFDASDLPSGMYFYKLDAGSFSQTRKMILLR